MNIPDYISPVIGYRVWQWRRRHRIRSLNGERWHPGDPLAAGCKAASRHAEVVRGTHDTPQADCTCGVYATKSFDHLHRTGYDLRGICGAVWLWGTVVEHKFGWRAQCAYPKNFVLPLSMTPLSMGMLEAGLKVLVEYGCDIFVPSAEGSVPLWLRGSGYEAGGLDLLIQRCHRWYARREQQRRIKRGDRVAVLGCGIGVVEQVNEKEAHVVLSRLVLRISRREIIWDELN